MVQTWSPTFETHSAELMLNRPSRSAIGCDPHTELQMLADVLLREWIEDPLAVPKIVKLRCIEIGDHIVLTDVNVELIAR
jgi:hypothetical protein